MENSKTHSTVMSKQIDGCGQMIGLSPWYSKTICQPRKMGKHTLCSSYVVAYTLECKKIELIYLQLDYFYFSLLIVNSNTIWHASFCFQNIWNLPSIFESCKTRKYLLHGYLLAPPGRGKRITRSENITFHSKLRK